MTNHHSISPLRQRMLDDMRMRKLKPKTQAAYLRAVVRLSRFLKRSQDTATAEDLRDFQLHLLDAGVTAAVFENCREHGLILSKSGPHRSVLRMVPPLCLSLEDVDRVAEGLDKALSVEG